MTIRYNEDIVPCDLGHLLADLRSMADRNLFGTGLRSVLQRRMFDAELRRKFVPSALRVLPPEAMLQAWEYFRSELARGVPQEPVQFWVHGRATEGISRRKQWNAGALPHFFRMDQDWWEARLNPGASNFRPLRERVYPTGKGEFTMAMALSSPRPARHPRPKTFQSRFPQLRLLLMDDFRQANRVQVDWNTGWAVTLLTSRSFRRAGAQELSVGEGREAWVRALRRAFLREVEEQCSKRSAAWQARGGVLRDYAQKWVPRPSWAELQDRAGEHGVVGLADGVAGREAQALLLAQWGLHLKWEPGAAPLRALFSAAAGLEPRRESGYGAPAPFLANGAGTLLLEALSRLCSDPEKRDAPVLEARILRFLDQELGLPPEVWSGPSSAGAPWKLWPEDSSESAGFLVRR